MKWKSIYIVWQQLNGLLRVSQFEPNVLVEGTLPMDDTEQLLFILTSGIVSEVE